MKVSDYLRTGSTVQWWVREAMSRPLALKTLGFHPTAKPTEREILKVHRKLALVHHPDRGGDPEKMKTFNHAKDVLIGRIKATHPSMEDFKTDPGMDFHATQEEKAPPLAPTPPEAKIVSWDEAARKAGIPSGIDWKLRTDDSYGGEMEGPFHVSMVTYVVYGFDSHKKHYFVQVTRREKSGVPREWEKEWSDYLQKWERFKELAPDQAKGKDPPDKPPVLTLEDSFLMKVETLPPGKHKSINALLEKLGGQHWYRAALLKDGTKFDRKSIHTFRLRWRSTAEVFKLMQKAHRSDPMKKLKVEIEMYRTLDGKAHVQVLLNSKEHDLKDESVQLMEKQGILKTLWPKEPSYSGDRGRKQLTRGKKAKETLAWMAENLVREPDKVRWMLKAAGDQIK